MLFNIETNKVLSEIKKTSFNLEEDIQELTELNLELIFGLQFVKHEYSFDNFRIDTLAYNKETNSFVIIEYKNTRSSSVIDQGYSYLSKMLNNKADFILEYNELMDVNLKKNEVDWSQSKVMFISPEFTKYQKNAINFAGLPFELWEVKKFGNDIIMYSQIESSSTENIKAISTNNNAIKTVSKEIKSYTENDHLDGKPSKVKELYETLKNEILNIGDITLKPTKKYIAYTAGKRNIVDLIIQSNKIKVYINLKFNEIDDPKKIVRDMTNVGSWGNGDCETMLQDIEEIDYLLILIKQSYKKNG